MRAILRDRLQDDEQGVDGSESRKTNAQLNSYLNQAALRVWAAVRQVDSRAFHAQALRPISAGVDMYRRPRGLVKLKSLWAKYDTSGFVRLDPTSEQMIDDEQIDEGRAVFANAGPFVRLWPVPTQAFDPGLEFRYLPSLSLGGDEDPDDDRIDLEDQGLVEPLHILVPLWAYKLVAPAEGESVRDVDAEIQQLQSEISLYYMGGVSDEPRDIRIEGLS
jgi:hypothetical protein